VRDKRPGGIARVEHLSGVRRITEATGWVHCYAWVSLPRVSSWAMGKSQRTSLGGTLASSMEKWDGEPRRLPRRFNTLLRLPTLRAADPREHN
jgi:hypothetical protein